MNRAILVGRLTRDPEVRYTQTGKAVASFSIAVDSGFNDNKRTDFIPIVVWDKLAEVCGNNLSKGRRILVEGRLQVRDYQDKDGQKRRASEVIAQNIEFLDGKKDAGIGNGGSPAKSGYDVSSFGTEVFPEEEIPF